jgi:ribonuclease D
VVGGLAALKPKTTGDLAQLRRLDAGVRRQLGDAILAAVARGEGLAEDRLPERPARPLGSARDTVAALLSVVAGEIARDSELPTNLLVPRASLERVAREVPLDRAAFDAALELEPWRLELVGEPLWRLLSGGAGVVIEGYADGNPKVRLSHESPPQ